MMKTILLIEDNLEIRENTAELLELASYNILTAENGLSGFEMAKKHIPDLILCDIMMPGLNGYEVLKSLRDNNITKNIPLVFITAKTEKKEMDAAFRLGANAYIRKPFETQDLLNSIEQCLNEL